MVECSRGFLLHGFNKLILEKKAVLCCDTLSSHGLHLFTRVEYLGFTL